MTFIMMTWSLDDRALVSSESFAAQEYPPIIAAQAFQRAQSGSHRRPTVATRASALMRSVRELLAHSPSTREIPPPLPAPPGAPASAAEEEEEEHERRTCAVEEDEDDEDEQGPLSANALLEAARPCRDAVVVATADARLVHFRGTLCRYQRKALHFMLERESPPGARDVQRRSVLAHALMRRWRTPGRDELICEPVLRPGLFCAARGLSPTNHDGAGDAAAVRRSGLLADSMGLGRTAVVIALVLAHARPVAECDAASSLAAGMRSARRSDAELAAAAELVFLAFTSGVGGVSSSGNVEKRALLQRRTTRSALNRLDASTHEACLRVSQDESSAKRAALFAGVRVVWTKATLLVLPRVLVAQWRHEIAKFVPSLRVYHNEGFAQRRCSAETFLEHDAAICAFEDAVCEFDAGMRSPLLWCSWWRLVVDEAQLLASTQTKAVKILRCVEREHTWCCTGAPLSNGAGDLRGLADMIQVEPYCSSKPAWARLECEAARGTPAGRNLVVGLLRCI